MLAGPGFWDAEIVAAGWSRVSTPPVAAFPETAARATVWGRNYYIRAGQRLVLEWSGPVTLQAVLLDGIERRVDTVEQLSDVIRARPPR